MINDPLEDVFPGTYDAPMPKANYPRNPWASVVLSVDNAEEGRLGTAKITRRQYIYSNLIRDGMDWWSVREAIERVAIEHPNWVLDELRTVKEWKALDAAEGRS